MNTNYRIKSIINNENNHQNEVLSANSKKRMEFVNNEVQSLLRQAVDKLGWSDTEVARYSGQPQSTVYRLLNAKTANPPFALVYDVCQTLGIVLSFNDNKDSFTAPITLYIGIPNASKKKLKEIEFVHVLPEHNSLHVGKIIDDCANRRYPKGSLLFISFQPRNLNSLKPKDFIIARVANDNSEEYFIPMVLVEGPNIDEWVLHHLTDNKTKQFICGIDKKTRCGNSGNKKIQLVGVIQKALI